MDVKVFGPESFITLPAAPNTCPECGVLHRQNEPHDAKSLLYQVRFQREHGRFPTWEDAWAHCEPAVQQEWAAAIADHATTEIELADWHRLRMGDRAAETNQLSVKEQPHDPDQDQRHRAAQ